MAQSYDDPSRSTLPDRGLPPVEPPSARFIIQLFVVPGVIVTIIVLVWLLFNWLAQMGSDPTKYVEVLASNSKARWQAAASLADVLNDPRNGALKSDRRLAQKLADLLAAELEKPAVDSDDAKQQVKLEEFLCIALGEFKVPEAVPPLVTAAMRTRPEDIAVRFAALKGLAVVASNLPASDNPSQPEMDAALFAAAADADSQIRCVAAFALGVEGDAAANQRLEEMLSDIYPDVRFNAATGLARHGNAAGIAVILEMLDPTEQPRSKPEKTDDTGNFKHNLIVVSGLQVAPAIYTALKQEDRQALRHAVDRLRDKDQAEEIRMKAADVWRQLDAREEAAQKGG